MTALEIGWRQQATTEYRPYAVDFLLEMDQGDAVGAVTSSLTDLLTGLPYPAGLPSGPSATGTVVTQVVSALVAGHNYRLVLTANMGGQKLTSTAVNIACSF